MVNHGKFTEFVKLSSLHFSAIQYSMASLTTNSGSLLTSKFKLCYIPGVDDSHLDWMIVTSSISRKPYIKGALGTYDNHQMIAG